VNRRANEYAQPYVANNDVAASWQAGAKKQTAAAKAADKTANGAAGAKPGRGGTER